MNKCCHNGIDEDHCTTQQRNSMHLIHTQYKTQQGKTSNTTLFAKREFPLNKILIHPSFYTTTIIKNYISFGVFWEDVGGPSWAFGPPSSSQPSSSNFCEDTKMFVVDADGALTDLREVR